MLHRFTGTYRYTRNMYGTGTRTCVATCMYVCMYRYVQCTVPQVLPVQVVPVHYLPEGNMIHVCHVLVVYKRFLQTQFICIVCTIDSTSFSVNSTPTKRRNWRCNAKVTFMFEIVFYCTGNPVCPRFLPPACWYLFLPCGSYIIP